MHGLLLKELSSKINRPLLADDKVPVHLLPVAMSQPMSTTMAPDNHHQTMRDPLILARPSILPVRLPALLTNNTREGTCTHTTGSMSFQARVPSPRQTYHPPDGSSQQQRESYTLQFPNLDYPNGNPCQTIAPAPELKPSPGPTWHGDVPLTDEIPPLSLGERMLRIPANPYTINRGGQPMLLSDFGNQDWQRATPRERRPAIIDIAQHPGTQGYRDARAACHSM